MKKLKFSNPLTKITKNFKEKVTPRRREISITVSGSMTDREAKKEFTRALKGGGIDVKKLKDVETIEF